jgi:hypothetical protein
LPENHLMTKIFAAIPNASPPMPNKKRPKTMIFKLSATQPKYTVN